MWGAIGYPWVEELSGGSPPRVRGGGRARGSQLISPAPSELPGSVLLLHKPAGRLGDALTLESAVEESQAHCPSSYPAHRGVGNGLRRPEDSLRGGSAGSGFQPCCRLDWMTQNGSHGSGGRRGGKRYPSQLGTLSSLPGPAGLFALLRPSWVFLLGCSCSSCLHGWPLLTLQVSNQIPPPLPGERIGERPSFPSPASPTVDPACLFGA